MDENTWEFKGRGHPVTVSCGCHTQIWVKSSGHVASSERPLSNRKPLRCPPEEDPATRQPLVSGGQTDTTVLVFAWTSC
jgi:hypothetical protein